MSVTKKLGNAAVWIGVVLMFAPIAISLSAGLTASLLGCELHEGFVNACQLGGLEIGEILYTAGLFGWLSLATLPLSFVLIIGGGGVLLLRKLVKKIRNEQR